MIKNIQIKIGAKSPNTPRNNNTNKMMAPAVNKKAMITGKRRKERIIRKIAPNIAKILRNI